MIPVPPQDCQKCKSMTVFPRPEDVIPDGSGGVLAVYRCPCGHVWACGWRMDVLGEAA